MSITGVRVQMDGYKNLIYIHAQRRFLVQTRRTSHLSTKYLHNYFLDLTSYGKTETEVEGAR